MVTNFIEIKTIVCGWTCERAGGH